MECQECCVVPTYVRLEEMECQNIVWNIRPQDIECTRVLCGTYICETIGYGMYMSIVWDLHMCDHRLWKVHSIVWYLHM